MDLRLTASAKCHGFILPVVFGQANFCAQNEGTMLPQETVLETSLVQKDIFYIMLCYYRLSIIALQ